MKNIRLFLFALICFFISSFVFAKSNIIVKDIKPIYDANSGIVVDGNDVLFTDKDQTIKYKVTLKNDSNKDFTIDSIDLNGLSADFLVYDIEGLEAEDVLVAKKEKDFVLSFTTVKKDGWGKNFDNELTLNLNLDNGVINPNTDSTGLVFILIAMFFITGLIVIFVSNKKINRYIVLFISFGSLVTVVNAIDGFVLPIKINVSYQSQNVMQKSYHLDLSENLVYDDYWKYDENIKDIIIDNDNMVVEGYDYKFDVSDNDNGKVLAYLVKNPEDQNFYDLYLVSDGIIYMNQDASNYFYNMKYLDNIINFEGMSSSLVTDMTDMFSYTSYNNDSFNVDLSVLDTSNVTDMSYMFNKACYNCSKFEIDISGFDTSKVENMRGMFAATAYSSSSFELKLENLDTSNVTDMSYMFNNMAYKTTDFDIDLSSFNTSKVVDMTGIFCNLGHFVTDFSLDISNFDTSNVKNMYRAFYNVGYESPTFEINFGEFDLSSVENFQQAFYRMGYKSTKMNASILISNPNVSNYSSMFSGVALNSGSSFKVNYTAETEELVKKIINTKSSNANIVEGKMIVEVDTLKVGDTVKIDSEYFNVFGIDGDNLLLLAKYNIGTDYRQTETENNVSFSDGSGWEYLPGPKEIDIQTWSSNPKTYINEYVLFLNSKLGSSSTSGDLVSLLELKGLGCKVTDDYTFLSDLTCADIEHSEWLTNGKKWWTKSSSSEHSYMLFNYDADGSLDCSHHKYIKVGIRPVITISKDVLNAYLKA